MTDIGKSLPAVQINPYPMLHPWIGSNPIHEVKELENQASKWNLLSKISYIAITSIALSVLAASLFLSATTTVISLSLLFPVVVTPLIALSASQAHMRYMVIQSKIELERPVADEFEKIRGWQSPEIAAFLTYHNITLPSSNIELSDFLPLIARYNAREKQIKHLNAESEKLLHSSNLHDRELRTWQRNIGWDIRERKTIPSALEAAFVLQILKNPTLNGDLAEYFTLIQKSFEERQFDRLYSASDTYLVFQKEKYPPLELETMMDNLDPDKLNKLLFPDNRVD